MESLWASFNALIFVGLLFAALPGLRMGNKTLASQIYGNAGHHPELNKNNELTDGEKIYIKERIKEILDDKMNYVIGFAMSAVGTFGTLFFNVQSPNEEVEKKLQLAIYIFFWLIVARVLKIAIMKYKEKKIIKEIDTGKIDFIKNGTIILSVEEINSNKAK